MKAFIHTVLYQPLYNVLIYLTMLMPGHSIALAIILLTIVIRLALLPQSLKAAYFQIKNLEIQPKINKIRKEITEPKAQQEAIMAVYKAEGHSPFSSCLPTLIQIPIIFVLYSVFRSGLSGNGYADLYNFIPKPDFITTFAFGMDLTKPDLWIMPLIAGGTQLAYSLMMMPKTDKTQEQDAASAMSKQMVFMMPIMTAIICRITPAALVLYWIVTTLFFIAQQWYINNKYKKKPSHKMTLWEKFKRGFTSPSPLHNDFIESKALNTEAEIKSIEPAKPSSVAVDTKKSKQDEMMLKMMKNKLDKSDKKTGVNITIRKKGE
jgi:YidC/Oxa1 family membrane protein insertase